MVTMTYPKYNDASKLDLDWFSSGNNENPARGWRGPTFNSLRKEAIHAMA
jgi:hypothetical protein